MALKERNEKKPDKGCNHQWKQIGCWDGENIKTHQPVSGPVAKCSTCGGKIRFTWEGWKKLPKEIKTELEMRGED